MSIVVYPGTFDPITLGHQDLIARAARLFDQVIVAVAKRDNKSPLFDHATRIELVEAVLAGHQNIRVTSYDGLLVDFAKQEQATGILRGLRNVTDLGLELPLAVMNRSMAPELETVFMTPDAKYLALSSTLVREVVQLGGDTTAFIDPIVATKIAEL